MCFETLLPNKWLSPDAKLPIPLPKETTWNLTTQLTPPARGKIVDYYRRLAFQYACFTYPYKHRALCWLRPQTHPVYEIRIVRPRQNHHLGCASSVNPPPPATSMLHGQLRQNRQTQTVEPQDRVCYIFLPQSGIGNIRTSEWLCFLLRWPNSSYVRCKFERTLKELSLGSLRACLISDCYQ